ncbi:MAG TPA: hypothetical protein PKH94_04265, partial [Bacteroidales bacterium]|nr:hypothetical protein [Bacteroidales bacterium]
MLKQILFAVALVITLGIFSVTTTRILKYFRITKPFPIGQWGKRTTLMLKVAFGQSKILRKPVVGFMHALVWWGFIVILIGSIEMVIDGLFGTERALAFLGPVYDAITALADIFALIIGGVILAFLARRIFLHIKRFTGIEMKHTSHADANIALTLIFLLMVSLLGMNTFYLVHSHLALQDIKGTFPVSSYIASAEAFSDFSLEKARVCHEGFWWSHILLIFLFANVLPYSKHFHVFMSVPNVFLSRLEPLGYLPNMENVTKEVKLMMDPATAYAPAPEGQSEA